MVDYPASRIPTGEIALPDAQRPGNNVIGGRERVKHIDIRKHFAHEVIQNGHIMMKLVHIATSLRLPPTGGYSDQAAALSAMADVRRGHLGQEDSNYHLRNPCPQGGMLSPRLSESSRVTSAFQS